MRSQKISIISLYTSVSSSLLETGKLLLFSNSICRFYTCVSSLCPQLGFHVFQLLTFLCLAQDKVFCSRCCFTQIHWEEKLAEEKLNEKFLDFWNHIFGHGTLAQEKSWVFGEYTSYKELYAKVCVHLTCSMCLNICDKHFSLIFNLAYFFLSLPLSWCVLNVISPLIGA